MPENRVVSREEWLAARRDLMAREKEVTCQLDALRVARQALPQVRVETDYRFDTPAGRRTLAELFEGRSQLVVHHLMFDPDWEAACVGCSFQADHIEGPRQHLEHHDVKIVAVSRAPLAKLDAYRRRMGWSFDWVSSHDSDFNYDFQVSFTDEQVARGRVHYNFGTITDDARYIGKELPGVSVFRRNGQGQVFHTYSAYARGLDILIGAHHYLDMTPKGRNEAAEPHWLRRHDEYDAAPAGRTSAA